MHLWLQLERQRVPDGKRHCERHRDYSLSHWAALTANLQDGNVPIDNNHIENLMRPWAMGRKAWLFAGSELAGQRAAVIMSLVQSAKLNGHDPWAGSLWAEALADLCASRAPCKVPRLDAYVTYVGVVRLG